MDLKQQSDQTVRISLGWVVVGLIGFVFLGFLGGVVAQQIFPVSQSLVRNEGQVVTTVQEVVVSPSKTAAEVVSQARQSVWLIGAVTEQWPPNVLSSGLLVTNDGVIAVPGQLPDIPLQAIDGQGVSLNVDKAGYDPLFDVSFLRLKNGVFSSVDFDQSDPRIAHRLWALTISPTTLETEAEETWVKSYRLPGNEPAGITRTMQIGDDWPALWRGAPLMTEEGRVAGIIINPETGQAMPVRKLADSLQRLTGSALESDPLERWGLDVSYAYAKTKPEEPPNFVAKVGAVTPNGLAQKAGFKAGDLIVTIGGEQLTWEESIIDKMSATKALPITAWRGDESLALTLTP